MRDRANPPPLVDLDAPAPVALQLQQAGIIAEGQPLITTPPPLRRRDEEPAIDLRRVIRDTPPPVLRSASPKVRRRDDP